MYIVKKRMEIAGSHCLKLNYESKCRNIHGHNWIVNVYCRSETLNSNGMVIDFTEIKKRIHDRLDHGNLNELIEQPTAENMARWICEQLTQCFKVTVQESEGNDATYIQD